MPKYSSQDQNVTFYINSVNGVYIYDYLGHKSFVQEETGGTVLFKSGEEFLVCKVEKKAGMTNIYLRNVTLGLSQQQTVLWTDNLSTSTQFVQPERMLNYRIQNQVKLKDQDFQLVLKTNSLTTRAYLDSIFFYLSLYLG